ncbi:hypothetical protein [Frondihabitans cladoniiphilus]
MDHVQDPQFATPVAPTPLPLRFSAPPGWPRPSVDWLAANQGWDPPAGWTPAPGVAPAPVGWVWWTRDEVGWKRATGAIRTAFLRRIIVAASVSVIGIALTVATLTLHTTFVFVAWGAIIFGPVTVIRNLVALRRANAAFLVSIRGKAAEVRQTLDTTTYSSYLAGNPPEPLPFDAFLAQRSGEAWSFTGVWPLTQNHLGVTDQFAFPAPPTSKARTVSTVVFAGIAAVVLIGIVVTSVGAAHTGSSTASVVRGDGGTSASGPADVQALPAGDRDFTTTFLDEDASSTATCNADYCWGVRITSKSTCTKAEIVMEFSPTKTGEPTRHESYILPLKNGTGDIAAAALDRTENYADIADSWCLAS